MQMAFGAQVTEPRPPVDDEAIGPGKRARPEIRTTSDPLFGGGSRGELRMTEQHLPRQTLGPDLRTNL